MDIDDEEFDRKLRETEQQIEGIDRYVSSIRSGSGLPPELLRKHSPHGERLPSAPETSKPGRRTAADATSQQRTDPNPNWNSSTPFSFSTHKEDVYDVPRGRAHLPKERSLESRLYHPRHVVPQYTSPCDYGDRVESCNGSSPSPMREPPKKHMLSSSSSSVSVSIESDGTTEEDEENRQRQPYHHHAVRSTRQPKTRSPLSSQEPQLDSSEAKAAFRRGVQEAIDEQRPRPCTCPLGECEAARILEEESRKANARLMKQLERESQERVQREALKLKHEMDGKYRMGMHEMDEEYSKKLETLKQDLQEEREVRQEERQKAAQREEKLISQLKELKTENHELSLQAESDATRINMLTNKLNHMESLLDDIEKEQHSLKTDVISLRSTKETLEQQLRTERGTTGRLQCDLDHAETQLLHLGAENRRLEGELEAAAQAKAALEQEHETLKSGFKETRDKLARVSASLNETGVQFDKLQREYNALKNRLAEAETQAKLKESAHSDALREIDDMKQREHYWKQEVSCYVQRLTEKDEETRELIRTKRELDAARSRIKDLETDLTTARNESKQLQCQRERDTLELRKLNNDVLLLTQESVKLRKELNGFRQAQSHLNPLVFGGGTKAPEIGDTPIIPTQSSPRPDAGRLAWEHHKLPAAGVSEALPSEWTYKPPDGIPLYGGGGGMKAPDISVPDQPPASADPPVQSVLQTTQLVGSGCVLPKAPTAFGILHIEGLEKQLMLLQMEKNQIESELSRFPANTRGHTMKQRNARAQHEERLSQVEGDIHKIRQELRLAGRRRPF